MTRLFSLIFIALTAMLPSFGYAGSSEAGKPILPAAEVAAFSNRVGLTRCACRDCGADGS
ncbi:hypothetical protein [Parasedimentitalea maritima]|uniref:hypothetical protein n=1 Tax=Parasedimentitalea maritima TaxID=2578117 RepID=UPI001FD7779A|nr:hypothetical protein [Zongyanglinia marina]